MSTKVAKNLQRLKHRIGDFFGSCPERQAARELIQALAQQNRVWIFGGMLRDISLYGRKGFRSDIDIVVESNREELLLRLSELKISNVTFTKLGGVRFHYQNLDFDIWCLADTWAFKEQLIPLEDEQSLFRTTLMTWDAVLYAVHSDQIIMPDRYLEDLSQRRLELVLSKTPNEPGALIKLLRTIYNKRVEVLGPELCLFLNTLLGRYSVAMLQHYEFEHYQTHSFNAHQIDALRSQLRYSEPGNDLKAIR